MRTGAPWRWTRRGWGLDSLSALVVVGALLLGLMAGCSSSAPSGSKPGGSASSPAATGDGGQGAAPGQGVAQGNKMTPNVPQIVPAAVVQSSKGGPRLSVDEDTYDYGKVKLEDWVAPTYHLKNVGDEPLTIQGQPVVRTLAGC